MNTVLNSKHSAGLHSQWVDGTPMLHLRNWQRLRGETWDSSTCWHCSWFTMGGTLLESLHCSHISLFPRLLHIASWDLKVWAASAAHTTLAPSYPPDSLFLPILPAFLALSLPPVASYILVCVCGAVMEAPSSSLLLFIGAVYFFFHNQNSKQLIQWVPVDTCGPNKKMHLYCSKKHVTTDTSGGQHR